MIQIIQFIENKDEKTLHQQATRKKARPEKSKTKRPREKNITIEQKVQNSKSEQQRPIADMIWN